MKLKLFSVLALSGLIAAGVACGDSETDDDGDGGSGGSGGSPTTSTTKTSTSTKTTGAMNTTTTTGTPTTTTGSAGCDTGEPGDVNPLDQVCLDCVNCSQGAECMAEWEAYGGDPDYQAYVDCNGACPDGDTACFDACDAMYPGTADLYLAAVSCSVCGACMINCNAAANCM